MAVKDTWIHGLTSSVSQGADSRVSICPVADYWIYLQFDLRDVSGEIESAELRMTRFDGARPEEIVLYFIQDDAWSEASLTGTARPEPGIRNRHPASQSAPPERTTTAGTPMRSTNG